MTKEQKAGRVPTAMCKANPQCKANQFEVLELLVSSLLISNVLRLLLILFLV